MKMFEGRSKERGLVFMPAVVGFIEKESQVLLGLRKRVSLGLGQSLISGIGGKVGDSPEFADETFEQALVREFQEEIDVTPTKWASRGRVKFIFPAKPMWNQDVRIYTIHNWEGEPVESEVIKPEWFSSAELPWERMWTDNKHWVPRVLSGEIIDAVFLYDSNNELSDWRLNVAK